MANRCFLFAADSATDMVCVDSDRVSEIEVTNATTVSINYSANANNDGSIVLGVTNGKADDVVKELGRIILQGVGVITIADDVNSVYGIDGIEEVDSIAHS
jgi:hypothetical protein|tara:strand:- start:641 stop:943 length:303 start_codon:yes stop_codon:yes gene_type:complete